MASQHGDNGRSPSNAPLGAATPLLVLAPVVIIGIALLLVMRRRNNGIAKVSAEAGKTARRAGRKQKETRQRMVITLLINALENDMLRRGLVMGLKVARSRL